MASSNLSGGGRISVRRAGGRLGRGKAGRGKAPLWPGMLPTSTERPPAPRRAVRRGRRPWLVGSVAVAGSLAVAALVLVYTAAVTNPRQSATVADPVLGGGPGCEPTRTEQVVRGNGTGSTASGPDVVLAFQHAYYVSRSGAMARMLTSPDAGVPSIDLIDAGIASVPAGTQHCVLITPLRDGRLDVVITEVRPDTSRRTYRQFVTVAARDGAIVITKITPPT